MKALIQSEAKSLVDVAEAKFVQTIAEAKTAFELEIKSIKDEFSKVNTEKDSRIEALEKALNETKATVQSFSVVKGTRVIDETEQARKAVTVSIIDGKAY